MKKKNEDEKTSEVKSQQKNEDYNQQGQQNTPQQQNQRLTLTEKQEFVSDKLKTRFPIKITLFTGLAMILIGMSAIVLEIILIVNKAMNYQIGNGIWGGCFAIISGLLKLNMRIYNI